MRYTLARLDEELKLLENFEKFFENFLRISSENCENALF